MKNHQLAPGKKNNRITRRVIELHEKGFVMDFHLMERCMFQCTQSSDSFAAEDLTITVIDQVFDQFSKSIKYIHTVETSMGYKGVLLCDQVCTSQGFSQLAS